MSQIQKALLVVLVLALGIWGCAQGPAGSASADKVKALEAKVTRLDEDFRAAAAARDQYRKKLNESELAITQLRQEVEGLHLVVKERDDLRTQLKARATELAGVTAQFETFRKSLKDLIGQTEAAVNTRPSATVNTVSLPKDGKQ